MTPMKSQPEYPHPGSSAITSWARANVKVNTKPEIAIRSLLHRQGYRFRKNLRLDVPGLRVRIDIVFPRHRLAVFIDGCFWHNCPLHGGSPQSNVEYWQQKLERNACRDELVNERLREAGWHVLRIWEHVTPAEAAAQVRTVLQALDSSI